MLYIGDVNRNGWPMTASKDSRENPSFSIRASDGDATSHQEESAKKIAATKKKKTVDLSSYDDRDKMLSAHYIEKGWDFIKIVLLFHEIFLATKEFLASYHHL